MEDASNEEFLTPLQREYLKRNPDVQIALDAVTATNEQQAPASMGGWLRFLIVSLLVLGPLVSAAMTASELSLMSPTEFSEDQISRVELISWSYWAIRSAILFVGGWFLAYRLRPRSVTIAIICLWAAGPIPDFCLTAIYGRGLADAARSSIYAGIWTAYLLRSKRVKAVYFGSIRDYDQVFD